jgi:hypothetical protein
LSVPAERQVFWVGVLILAMLGGCAATPASAPPFAISSAQTTVSHYIGTPLSGPRDVNPSKVSLKDCLDVNISWLGLESFNDRSLPLLGSQARLVTAKLGDAAVIPSARLTSLARIQWTDPAGAVNFLNSAVPNPGIDLGSARAALPVGVTVAFRAVDSGGGADETLNHSEPRYIEIALARIPTGTGKAENLQIGVSVEDRQPSDDSIYQRESAILEHPFDGTNDVSFLVVIPFQFTGPASQAADAAVAAIVTIKTAPVVGASHAFDDALKACQADLQLPGSQVAGAAVWAAGLAPAIDQLSDPERRRAALVYLAGQADARICRDTAMVADDSILSAMSDSIGKDAPDALKAATLENLSWILDRSAISAMQPLLDKSSLAPELSAVLTLYMGEPGRHAAAVNEIMRAASSSADFHDRLISENYIYLEDSSPASRVRAFDWLKSHSVAPAGFDPLGSPKQRRQELDTALNAAANPSAPAAQTGGAP